MRYGRPWWTVLLKFLGVCTHESERIRSDGKVECLDCTRQRPLPKEWIADNESGAPLAAVMENMQRMERENRKPREASLEEVAALKEKQQSYTKRVKRFRKGASTDIRQ